MSEIWRLLDTGLQSPDRNSAINRALLEARHANEIPNTLRFGRSTRCVLVGYHDSFSDFVDLEYCRQNDIPIRRRIAGAATAYIDERQLLFELYVHRRDLDTRDPRTITKRICHAAATAVSALQADARLRGAREIAVDGRKLGEAVYVTDGDAILFQTILNVHAIASAPQALRMPGGQLGVLAVQAAHERIATLQDVLGCRPDVEALKHNLAEAFESEFDVEFRENDLTLSEQARFTAALHQFETNDGVSLFAGSPADIRLREALHESVRGLLRVVVAYDVKRHRARHVWFSGEAVGASRCMLFDLEAALDSVELTRLADRVEWFFASRALEPGMPSAKDFVTVLRRAIDQLFLARNA
ncbi:MAG: lipoate---protein ligase [Betaproteobacteria bacterium]